jgi:hypothetical protein
MGDAHGKLCAAAGVTLSLILRSLHIEAMHIPEQLEVTERYCRLRVRGVVPLVEAVERVTHAIAFCRDQNIPKLLVDVTHLAQLPALTLLDRFLMVEDWAHEAKGIVIVAMVARPEHIHPEKFGVKLAADKGLRSDVFTSEHEARQWLLAQIQSRNRPPAA